MIIVGIIVTLRALFLLSILRLFLSRWLDRPFDQVIPFLHQDATDVLAQLLDATLERHLAEVLNHRQFRKEQLNRIRLAHEYIGRRTRDVVVLQEWGDTEHRKSRATRNEEVRTLADALVTMCAEFRIGASPVQMQLRIWFFRMLLLPSTRVPHISSLRRIDEFDLLQSYEKITEVALKLAEACGGDYYERLRDAL
jgi:hypothetical protein